jgi:hypothetical protein
MRIRLVPRPLGTRFFAYVSALTLVLVMQAFAQESVTPVTRIYQLSGIVLNANNEEPVPFARVRVNSTRRRTTCNEEGFFSIPVVQGDTLYFSSIGYHGASLVVKDFLDKYNGDKNIPFIYAIQYMKEDTVNLQGIKVFAYNSPEELRIAMLNMPMDRYAPSIVAQGNVKSNVMNNFVNNMPIDEQERAAISQQQYALFYKQTNTMQTVPLFDPIAVGKLLKNIRQRAKEKQNSIYKNWPD